MKNFKRNKKEDVQESSKLITNLDPRSPYAELFRGIRTSIEYSSVDQALKSILITSSEPNSGKSITCANLAVVFAQQNKKTLLVDADMRKPTVKKIFPKASSKGLSGLLANKVKVEEAVCKTEIENLYVLPAGVIPPNPAELLGSNRMKQIYEELYAEFDQIIFDTPPIQLVVDAQLLGNFVDGSILLVRRDHTTKEASKKALEKLQSARANVLGSIFNDTKMKASDYYYGEG
ncbi:protein-tyrosine kinase [Listeria grandensis FSL F6-0971]|uniref:non-specific protein-tyrosine kinase n=1 Tax=Listeria grandensis FSL F6-0971 TaxID=1265819 RepID=W7BEM5_9LIST|nr:CpsD/CapB family tyrosine-protein kinase [Listeria grandensis]EUJ18233.1 protein-tyrosine kinase [Listeria grandensis FSL F6-0971]